MTRTTIAAALALTFMSADVQSQQSKPRVEVAGLSIAREKAGSKYGESMVQGLATGTTVHIQVNVPKQTVIKINEIVEDQITMTDSKGTNMSLNNSNLAFMSNISDDGSMVSLPIQSETLPSDQATSLSVKGKITLTVGADQVTEAIDVEIAKGKQMKIAGIDFKVVELGDSFMDEDAESFEIQSKKSPAQIKSIQAVLADGKTVDLNSAGNSSFGYGDDMTYGRTYEIRGKAANIKKLSVTFYKTTKAVDVPLDLTVNMGLK